MTIWIVYRKGSFYLKERIPSEALFEQRRESLQRQGATFVRIVHEYENNPWLQRTFELPHPSLGR